MEYLEEAPAVRLQVFADASRSVLSKNDSPDLGFRYSVNPYRGCVHACAYCYARPTHQYLDFGAGTDFDRKIVVKHRAPELLRAAFERKGWSGDTVLFSGNTDPYQALEASYGLTRACLEVCRDFRNPVGIITKAPLIERDLDVLKALHAVAPLRITVSVPLWDPKHARGLEPGVATPRRRMTTIARLADAGLDVGVNVAPLIPGLGDETLADVLKAAAAAGAGRAGWIMLRLPGPVAEVFESRLRNAIPLRADRVLRRIADVRGGLKNDPRFGQRMRGEGHHAQAIQAMFDRMCAQLGLNRDADTEGYEYPQPSTFRRPNAQLSLLDA